MSTNKNVDFEWKFDHKKLIKFRASARSTRQAHDALSWEKTRHSFARISVCKINAQIHHEKAAAAERATGDCHAMKVLFVCSRSRRNFHQAE